jgi:hypothetical protein
MMNHLVHHCEFLIRLYHAKDKLFLLATIIWRLEVPIQQPSRWILYLSPMFVRHLHCWQWADEHSVISGFFGKMKNWFPKIFLGWFSGNINFLQSLVGETENVDINERVYTILEIMSIQGYKMWANELSAQERICNQWRLSVKTIQYENIIIVNCF